MNVVILTRGGDVRAVRRQLEECTAYAQRMKLTVADICAETMARGAPFPTPAVQKILNTAKRKKRNFDGVLMVETGRVADDLDYFGYFWHSLNDAGVQVITAHNGALTWDKMSVATKVALGLI